MDLSNGWLAKNQQQKFPLDALATATTDDGRRLPDGLIADLSLAGFMIDGFWPFIAAVRSDDLTLSIAVCISRDENLAVDVKDFATLTVTKAVAGELVRVDVADPSKKGSIPATFALMQTLGNSGSGVLSVGNPSILFKGVFSTPRQSRLAPLVYRAVQWTPEFLTPFSTITASSLKQFRGISAYNLDGVTRNTLLTGTVTLESGVDMTVEAVTLLDPQARPPSPIVRQSGRVVKGIRVTGNLKNNLMYLPRDRMVDEDDCTASDYPPAIRTVGGVTPLATPQGGRMTIEFDSQVPGAPASADTSIQLINVTGTINTWPSLVRIGTTPLTSNIILTMPGCSAANVRQTITLQRLDDTPFTVTILPRAGDSLTVDPVKLNTKYGAIAIRCTSATGAMQVPVQALTSVDGYGLKTTTSSVTRFGEGQLITITTGSSIPSGALCKTPTSKPVPVLAACSDVAEEICSGLHTFGQIPVDWDLATDLPLSEGTPRLKPNGDPCPPLETLEDELITDYSAEFGNCFAPVSRGDTVCSRWYSRRVWAFDQTTQKDKIQIGSRGMSYAPTDWIGSSNRRGSPELRAAFLGMPTRKYLGRTILGSFHLDPGGLQTWSWSPLNPSSDPQFNRNVLRCFGALLLNASVDIPNGADLVQPSSAEADGLRQIESTAVFGVAFGTLLRYGDFVAGRPAYRTGYWLVRFDVDRRFQPGTLLLETTDLTPRDALLTVFAQRDSVTQEIYGTARCDLSGSPGATATHSFRLPSWFGWAGDAPIAFGEPKINNRSHLGFAIGPNTTISALDA